MAQVQGTKGGLQPGAYKESNHTNKHMSIHFKSGSSPIEPSDEATDSWIVAEKLEAEDPVKPQPSSCPTETVR